MLLNDSPVQHKNGRQEDEIVQIISKLSNIGYAPLITNDFSDWTFPHLFGVNLKDDPIQKPYQVLEIQAINCLLNSKSFHYWDDESSIESVEAILVLDVKLFDENGNSKINSIINMSVEYSFINVRDKSGTLHFDGFTSNNKCNFSEDINNLFDGKINLAEYDINIKVHSHKQKIIISTRDRLLRMNRILFKRWEFS